jgi:hypothetical protein
MTKAKEAPEKNQSATAPTERRANGQSSSVSQGQGLQTRGNDSGSQPRGLQRRAAYAPTWGDSPSAG